MGKTTFLAAAALVLAACADKPAPSPERVTEPTPALPTELAATGIGGREVRPFTPQYALWTDGAEKRRFIYLPQGAAIEASDPDAWQLPVGTKLWKEFAFGGRKVETRFIERTREGFRFATYVWSEDGTRATLAPAHASSSRAEIAPGVRHQIPGQNDCKVCHGSGRTPVLGFSALQLSADRDPNAVHREEPAQGSLDLAVLVKEGRLRGWSGGTSPRIAARSETERSALGYLHANCGHCHKKDGPLASLDLVFANGDATVGSTVDRPSRIAPGRMRVARRAPASSVLVDRIASREPASQMPPLGTQLVDEEAVTLLTRWVGEL